MGATKRATDALVLGRTGEEPWSGLRKPGALRLPGPEDIPGPACRSRMLEWAAGAVNSPNGGGHPGTGREWDDIQKRNDMATDTELPSRITVRPDVFSGNPIIRDMRIAAALERVLAMLAAGDSTETILSEYDFLEEEDIRACLLFTHRSLTGEPVHDPEVTLRRLDPAAPLPALTGREPGHRCGRVCSDGQKIPRC